MGSLNVKVSQNSDCDNNSDTPCFHCGLPSFSEFELDIEGQTRAFCCVGCQAVASTIAAGGLSNFYQYRDALSLKPDTIVARYEAFDHVASQTDFVRDVSPGIKKVRLLVSGVSCAACAWLIEGYLSRVEGVSDIHVNVSTQIVELNWQPEFVKLSEVFETLHGIAYRPSPATHNIIQLERKKTHRFALFRVGLAGLGMMQVGMLSMALHAGSIQGIDDYWQHFLRWVCLLFTLPVLSFSAYPFFKNSWRALRSRHLNMDVPVALALFLAFSASVVATVNNNGAVYFDSVLMFTFFLSLGRYLELRARQRSADETERSAQLLPHTIQRKISTGVEHVPPSVIQIGDCIFVPAGDVVPCDGELSSALAMIDESLITGESRLVKKERSDPVYAGSIVAEPAIEFTVSAVGDNTRLASVQKMLDGAIQKKPAQQKMADAIAGKFVVLVLLCFVGVGTFWYWFNPEQAFWIALSVLVVTCPCALSLATPVAITAGLNRLRCSGMILVNGNGLEVLPRITHIVFDKTGTLTQGRPQLGMVRGLGNYSEKNDEIIQILTALEAHSSHPFAQAFKHVRTALSATHIHVEPGKGIQGFINGAEYRFGVASFASQNEDVQCDVNSSEASGMWQLLSENGQAIAWVELYDAPRDNLNEVLSVFKQKGITLSLLSGDQQHNVDAFIDVNKLGELFTCAKGGLLAQDKLAYVQHWQQGGDKVLMMGDGINDVPVLGGADLSLAMAASSQLTQVSADAVLLNDKLETLIQAFAIAKRVSRCVRQNLMWALTYNLIALPAAALGFVAPWAAAIGMSLSSVIVVVNSLRITKV